MREQTWYERIINFFSRIFHKDSEEMSNKFKREMCEKSRNVCQGYCYSCAWKIDEEVWCGVSNKEEVDKNP